MTYEADFSLADGSVHTVIDVWEGEPDPGAVEYWWTMGNGDCDCNRSLALGMEELPCGSTIKLVGLRVVENNQ